MKPSLITLDSTEKTYRSFFKSLTLFGTLYENAAPKSIYKITTAPYIKKHSVQNRKKKWS